MSKHLIYSLLLSILMVIAPHADHLPLWVSVLCAALLLWRTWINYNENPLPKGWLLMLVTFAGIGGIAVYFHTLFGREAGVTLLMLLATLKLMELRTVRDAMAIIYLALFIIITNFFYSQSIPTALYMLATLFVIVTTWIHLQAQRITNTSGPHTSDADTVGFLAASPLHGVRTAALLLLQAIPLTLILFIMFPRVQGPLWGLPQDAFSSSGLDEKMTPGSLSRLILSEAVAFRVSYNDKPPLREQMYWRGPVLWYFDGNAWTLGSNMQFSAPQFAGLDQAIDYTVTLEPHNKTWLFALDVPDKISLPYILGHDFRLYNSKPVNARLRYDARSHLVYRANMVEDARQIRRALQLPKQFNPRARQLAAGWKNGGADNATIVSSALAYFNRQGFQYTLEPPLLGTNNIDEFMFETKQGFCEHYASAFVFLMRAANVPARVVTGYLGGEFNDIGNYYIVRQSDAHAWAEVWLAGQGWVRVDPTGVIAPARIQTGLSSAVTNNAALPFMSRNPPQWLRNLRLNWDALANQWNQWVLGYDTERQFAFLTRLGMESVTWQKMAINMALGLGLLIGLFALFMLYHLLERQSDPVQAAWLRLCRKLAKTGLPPRAAHEGACDYAERIGTIRPDLAAALHDLAARYNALRYGSPQHEQVQREFMQRCAALKIRQGIIFAT